MDQQKFSTSTIVLSIVTTALIVGGGVYWLQPSIPISQNSAYEKVAKFNCEQSGGAFSQSECQCPQEPKVNGAPAFSYEANGYCVDSFGVPGGEQGQTAKKLLELKMLKNQ